jgi:ribose-phosphate pyrophosphokinase
MRMSLPDPMLFSLDCGRAYAEKVARHLGVGLSAHEERAFEDSEYKIRPLVSVRGRDVFVVLSLYGDEALTVNDKLCRLLFFVAALKDAEASRVTAVVPYLCFARKDRQTKPRDPVTTRYVACLLEAAGVDRVVTLDVHNLAAFQNAFRCRTVHLEAAKLFADHLIPRLGEQETAVVSPDIGGVKRAERFRDMLQRALDKPVAMAFMEKTRSGGVVSGEAIVGDVAGKVAIVIDDLIAAGTTMARVAKAAAGLGASAIHAVATHGLFVGEANVLLAEPALASVVVTDSIPPFRVTSAMLEQKLVVLETAPLVAEAIRRLHTGGSIVELLEA